MIYLASPYSHPERSMRNFRYLRARLVVGHFIKMDLPIYSPIVHCHHISTESDLPYNADFWLKYNENFLRLAEALWILQLPDWNISVGVTYELKYWRDEKDALGRLLKAVDPETLDVTPFAG